MKRNQEEGIVLKTINYQENSKLVYIVTFEGLHTLLARGVKKRNSKNHAYTQNLTLINYLYAPGKGFDILTSGLVVNNFTNLKTDIDKIKHAYLVLEYSYQFINFVSDYNTFYNFLKTILKKMNSSDNYKLYEITFRLKILYLLGVGPKFSSCLICESKENLAGFSIVQGGSKCNNCREYSDVFYDDNIVNFLRFLYNVNINELTDEVLNVFPDIYNDLNVFLKIYYNQHLGYNSKVEKVFDNI